jgi:pimeloyl-ACP methyl ester carboxylesterase
MASKGTIMFIHGMFLNPESWRGWQQYFEARGYATVAPPWPYHDGKPAELRARVPAGLGELSLERVVEVMLAAATQYPDLILVGHSVGGLIVQKLIQSGIGRLGVPISSVAPNRMLSLDWGFFRNSATITNPLKGDQPFPMDADGFHRNFANTMERTASDEAFTRFALPDSRNILRDCMGDTGKINLSVTRAPMLFIGAEKDEIIPASLVKRNAEAYEQASPQVSYMEFANRGHFICGEPGWEEVAGAVHRWLEEQPGVGAVPRVSPELAPF